MSLKVTCRNAHFIIFGKNLSKEGIDMKKHKCCMYGDRCKSATVQITTRNGGKEWYCGECAKAINTSKVFHAIAGEVSVCQSKR